MEQVVINNITFNIRRDADGRINMNDAHVASGKKSNKAPDRFLRGKKAQNLIEKCSPNLENTQVVVTVIGNHADGREQGTYAHEDVFFAYCAWIDAEFYAAVAQVFGHVVRGDVEKAVVKAQSVIRIDSIDKRKTYTSALAKHGAQKADYSHMTDILNIAVFGRAAANLKKDRGLAKSAPLRESMTEEELAKMAAAEAIATMYLTLNKDRTHASMRESVYRAADAVKSLGI